jgi:DNA-binding IclR family transcriptional regulator
VVYLDRVSTTRVSLPTRVGGREPAYCTALGKVLLAFEDPARQASALADLPRRTEFTITEPRALQSALENARQTGVAFDREEAYLGVGCVASPIHGGGRVIGAVSVTGPIARVHAHSLVHDVRNTALAIWSRDVLPLPRPLLNAR